MKKKKEKKTPQIKSSSFMNTLKYDGLSIVLIFFISLLLYYPTLNHPFHYDDFGNIIGNPYIKNIKNYSLFLEGLRVQDTWFRALPTFTFAINYHFHRLEVFGYHLINLILHIGSGILVYFISKHLLAIAFKKDKNLTANQIAQFINYENHLLSLFVALIFIAHPIQVNTVTYIVQRNEGMASFFYLLGFFLFMRGSFSKGFKKAAYFSGAGIIFLFAILSKEIGFTLPIVMILFDLLFVCKDWEEVKRRIKIYLGLAILLSIYILFFLKGGLLTILFRQAHFWTPWENLLTQANVIIQYIKLLFLPWPGWLSIDHDFEVSKTLFEFPTFLSISAILCLLVSAVYFLKKKRLITFSIFWFFIILAPTSSLIPIWDIMVEYRLYLPLFSYGLLIALALHYLYHFLLHRYSERFSLGSLIGITVLILCLYSILTIQRNHVFKEGITLWEDAVRKSPNKARAHLNLGVMLQKGNRLEEAREMMEMALEKKPKNHPLVYYSLGTIYSDLGNYGKAISFLERYLKTDPNDVRANNEMGSIYLRVGSLEKANTYFQKALQINSSYAPAYAGSGDVYDKKGMIDEAIFEYKKAIQIDPDLTKARIRLGEAYMKKGMAQEAIAEMKEALSSDPKLPDTYVSIGAFYLREGRLEEAFGYFKKAQTLNPKNPEIYNNLGVGYRTRGQIDEAINYYRKAIELDPNLFDAHINLGEAYAMKKMMGEALSEYKKAIAIYSDRAEPYNHLGVLYLGMKKLDDAISYLRKAILVNPKYGEAYFNLAIAYYYKRDIQKASEYSQQALNLGYKVDPKFLELLKSRR